MSRKNAHHRAHAHDRPFGTRRGPGGINAWCSWVAEQYLTHVRFAHTVPEPRQSKPKSPQRKTYDKTLDVTRRPQTDEDLERNDFFEIMKKREF